MKRQLAFVLLLSPLALLAEPDSFTALSEGGAIGPGGVECTCDLPLELRKANIGSPPAKFKGDPRSLGCCVFRSLDHASRWQNVAALFGMPEWMVKAGIQGGGSPAKVDQLIPRIAKDRGLPAPDYVQHTGGDLEFVYQAIRTGRAVSLTYSGEDMHYGANVQVDHMVNCVHLDPPEKSPRMAAILDNNFISTLVWMTAAELEKRWKDRNGGWAVVLLAPAPPPVPRVK